MALTLSGLPSNKFAFQGFYTSKSKAARDALEASHPLTMTQIWFETSKRLITTLQADG